MCHFTGARAVLQATALVSPACQSSVEQLVRMCNSQAAQQLLI
jgi:hypothetical protein